VSSSRRALIWGWVFIAPGLLRLTVSIVTVTRHFNVLELVTTGVGIFFIAYGIQRVRRGRTSS